LQLPLLYACLAFSARLFQAFTFLRLSCLLLRNLLLPAPPPASSASCLSCHQLRYLPPPPPDCAPTTCASNLHLQLPLLICTGSFSFFATFFLSRPGTVTADTCNRLCSTCFFAASALQLPLAPPTSTCNRLCLLTAFRLAAPPTSTCTCHCSSVLGHLLSSRLFFYPDLAPSQLLPATASAPPASSLLLRSTCHLYLRPPLATATAHLIPATGSTPPASSPLPRPTCNLHLRPPLATATAHLSCVTSFLHNRRPATVTAAACSPLPCLPPPPDCAFRDGRPLF
jgi:hypothetical protein